MILNIYHEIVYDVIVLAILARSQHYDIPKLSQNYHIWCHIFWYDILGWCHKTVWYQSRFSLSCASFIGYCLQYHIWCWKIVLKSWSRPRSCKNLWYQWQLSCIIAYLSCAIAYDTMISRICDIFHIIMATAGSFKLELEISRWMVLDLISGWFTSCVPVFYLDPRSSWYQRVPALEVKFKLESRSVAPSSTDCQTVPVTVCLSQHFKSAVRLVLEVQAFKVSSQAHAHSR